MFRWEILRESGLACDTLSEKLLISIFRAYNVLSREFSRLFAKFGITEPQFNVLMLLAWQHEKGLQLSELGRRLLVTRANVTGLADRMERQGTVVRQGLPGDRRASMAKITEKGTNLLNQILPHYCEKLNQIAGHLEEGEKEALVHYLVRLRRGVESGREGTE